MEFPASAIIGDTVGSPLFSQARAIKPSTLPVTSMSLVSRRVKCNKPPFNTVQCVAIEMPTLKLPPRRYLRKHLVHHSARSQPSPREDPLTACTFLIAAWRKRFKETAASKSTKVAEEKKTATNNEDSDDVGQTPVPVLGEGYRAALLHEDVFEEALQNTLADCSADVRLTLLPRIGPNNAGASIMKQMGWHPSQGLGPNGAGPTEPTAIRFRPDGERKRRGLGYTDGMTAGQRLSSFGYG